MQNRKRNTTAVVAGFAALAGLSIATGAPALATAAPTTGGTVTTTPPSGSPSAGVSVTETGIYLYRKVDEQKPAAWENSGEQTFLAKQPGQQWFTDVTSLVPSVPFAVCGPGWAVQQDVLEFEGTYKWPEKLRYPDQTFPGNPELKASQHQELEDLMTVPDCAPTPTPTPEPTDPPSEQPTPTPTPTDTTTPTPTPSGPPAGSVTPTPTPTPTDTPSGPPSSPPAGSVTPSPTPTGAPSETPAGSVTPPAASTPPPAPGTTDPGVQVAGNPTPRVPDAGLAHTGMNGTWLAAAGAVILAVGAVLVVIARRRKA